MKSQKCKFLLLHILLLCGLALLVLKYVEEIQMFKQTIYDTIHPKSVSETIDDPITYIRWRSTAMNGLWSIR